jgi:hypothetical protein
MKWTCVRIRGKARNLVKVTDDLHEERELMSFILVYFVLVSLQKHR